jgi:hypothetical protein
MRADALEPPPPRLVPPRVVPPHCRCAALAPTPPPVLPHRPKALKDPSALFRHDVAFCMGQRQDPAAVEVLQAILRDSSEHPM